MNREQSLQLIKRLTSDVKAAKQYFKMAYNYDNLNEDFVIWYEQFKGLTEKEQVKAVNKGVRNGDFDKVLNVLMASKGNPLKAYMMLKVLKNEQKEETN